MCTVSFVPNSNGFLIGMNRDEQRSRVMGNPPSIRRCGDLAALYPSEPGGGTWVGVNSAGICAALINWYSRSQEQGKAPVSRGTIIPHLMGCLNLEQIDRSLMTLPLDHMNPFRLFIIGRESGVVREYRSEGTDFEQLEHPWLTGHWFSSGIHETSVAATRGAVCSKANSEPDAGTLRWLKRLHSSHDPEEGESSICMHRHDAVTVSMTLLQFQNQTVSMSYHKGSPCQIAGEASHNSRLMIGPI